jgi:hypothetical protein
LRELKRGVERGEGFFAGMEEVQIDIHILLEWREKKDGEKNFGRVSG